MRCKTFEIRDRMTFIAALAVKLEPECERDRHLFGRSGYGTTSTQQGEYVLLAKLAGGLGPATSDPFEWLGSRTMQLAHQHIIDHFDELESGCVIDVEYLLGETAAPKAPDGSRG